MIKKLRKHIIFHGHVQGVGFRYTARAIADELGLTGWVRNCWDGTVEMEVQGTPLDISTLLHRLQNSSRWIEITSMDIKPLPVDEDERVFHTRSSY